MTRNRWATLLTALAFAAAGAVCVGIRLRSPEAHGVAAWSPESREMMGLILLVPIGTLITVFVRNVVGIQTFGTFSPSLLAISLVHADMKSGLLVFLAVIVVAIIGRLALGRLRILIASRLSLLLVLVVLCLVTVIPRLQAAGFQFAVHSVLLSMVMLTMIIEHFHVTLERDGYIEALQVLGGTAVVTACCVLVFRMDTLECLLYGNPEMLLFVAALLVLLGSYTGYRLVELVRFRGIDGRDNTRPGA